MSTTEELAKQAGVDIMQHEWQWSYKWPASLEALEKFRELAVAEEREIAVRVLADILETGEAHKLHGTREEDARTLLRLARERANVPDKRPAQPVRA